MVSKSMQSNGRNFNVLVEQQPRCESFHNNSAQCSDSLQSNGDTQPNSERTSSSSSERYDEQELASSSSPSNNNEGGGDDDGLDESKRIPYVYYNRNCCNLIKPCPTFPIRKYLPSIVGLHDEIHDLYLWLKPTAEEIACRRQLFNKISALLEGVWADARVTQYGSVATNSFLPSSDVDICINASTSISVPDDLNRLADVLRESSAFENITVLDKAAVPIVKCTDQQTQLSIDLNFNLDYVNETVEWIRQKMFELPLLEPLLLVLKQFLAQHGLNNPFNGGLPSYALVVMLVYFLEVAKNNLSPNNWYAQLLLRSPLGLLFHYFLYHFGYQFDYTRFGIKVAPEVQLVSTAEMAAQFGEEACSSGFWVSDPVKKGNNLGKGAHNILAISAAFRQAYGSVANTLEYCKALPEAAKEHYFGPMLSLIISISDSAISQRAENIRLSRKMLRLNEEGRGHESDQEEEEEEHQPNRNN